MSDPARAPTSGGQYHWVAQLAPARFAVTFSWAAGGTPSWFKAFLAYLNRLGNSSRETVCLRRCCIHSRPDDSRVIDSQLGDIRTNALACNDVLLGNTLGFYAGKHSWHQGLPTHWKCCLRISHLFLFRAPCPFGLSIASEYCSFRLCRLWKCRRLEEQWSFLVHWLIDFCMGFCWSVSPHN